ncbi:probable glutathione S-transferase parA [Phalaenopsis equestris]|uniref:probable glutathione S-transferase parA n=1 Tax=Phalaenopsis equestris TaxID=78828 RepID=UPI0009E19A83|nr:probable glutathione S-transferase parA [Phalaenopsis equestris]
MGLFGAPAAAIMANCCAEAVANKLANYSSTTDHRQSPLIVIDHTYHRRPSLTGSLLFVQFFECGTKLWKQKSEALQKAKKEFIQILKTLEAELGDKKYFGGDAFGLVDIALVPFTSWFYSYQTLAGFSVEQESSNLVAWAKRCLERESVAKTLYEPKKIYEFVGYLRKKYGME